MQECFVVKYVSVQNCFVYVPNAWLRKVLTKPNAIKLSNTVGDYYLSWHSRPSPDDSLCLNATFAKSLGIKEGEKVFISCAAHPGSLTSVTVVPQCTQDWEIVELQSSRIQSTLLDQISIVAKNQSIIIWISKFLCLTLIVDSLEPNFKYGKLEQFTQVIVSQGVTNIRNKSVSQSRDTNVNFRIWSVFNNFLPTASEKYTVTQKKNISERTHRLLRAYKKESTPEMFQVYSLPKKENFHSINVFDFVMQQPYHVFVHERHLPKDFAILKDFRYAFYKVRKVRENCQCFEAKSTYVSNIDDFFMPKESSDFVVKLFIVEDVLEKCSIDVNKEYFANKSIHKSIYVSEELRMHLNVDVGTKVTLRCFEISEQSVSCIEIFPFDKSITQDTFKNYIRQQSNYDKILLNSWTSINFNEGKRCILRVLPEQCLYVLLNEISLKNITIRVNDVIPNIYDRGTDSSATESICLNKVSIRSVQYMVLECQAVLSLSLSLHNISSLQCDRENILICGNVGTGKTTICEILRMNLQKAPYFVHTHFIDCNSFKGKKVEALQKIFLSVLSNCMYHQPSVLFLDNFESITCSFLKEEGNTPGAINADRIADMLLSLITEYQCLYYIAIVATCINVNKIGQKFRASRGIHLFGSILTIPHLKKEDRVDVLRLTLKTKFCVSKEINWDYYGNKTEGWMAQDLVDMAEKAAFVVWKRHARNSLKSPLILLEDDMSHSLDCSTPMSLYGIHLYKGFGHSWSDIGGLVDVKRTLIELVYWPLKHPDLFKNAPIKRQIGILLYGMPGTGKTMLVGAIAKECGLSLISVKGPELLSKYIGASEEAVRIIFEKAHCAKPCILFFDEFESFVPRRGHDNTGVTDRVVNQLLTQLDGIEGREGITVITASSRPDLMDPALLRPGRLDKPLLCSLPNQNDREEIIIALCKIHNINMDGLDFKALATMTPGYTGADLNAAFLQAKLTVLEEVLTTSLMNEQAKSGRMQVSQKYLADSLKSTHPSLPSREKARYKKIYLKFMKEDNVPEDISKNQRTILA